WSLVTPAMPDWTTPDLSLLGNFSFGAFSSVGATAASLLNFAILLSVFFDAMGTSVGLSREAGNVDKDGTIPRLNRVLLVDAIGVTAGGSGSRRASTMSVETGNG